MYYGREQGTRSLVPRSLFPGELVDGAEYFQVDTSHWLGICCWPLTQQSRLWVGKSGRAVVDGENGTLTLERDT